MVCDHYQSGDHSKELAQIWHLIIKHNLYPDGSWHGVRFAIKIFSKFIRVKISVPTKPIFFNELAICWSKGK